MTTKTPNEIRRDRGLEPLPFLTPTELLVMKTATRCAKQGNFDAVREAYLWLGRLYERAEVLA